MSVLISPLSCQREAFNLDSSVIYINGAYMSPQLKVVEMAGIEALKRKSRPYSIKPVDFFEPMDVLRKTFAQLVHISDPQRVVLIPSVSYGMSTVAKNLKCNVGDNIVVVDEQFPSNYYAWQRLAQEQKLNIRIIKAPESGEHRGQKWNRAILEHIDSRTVMVSMGHIHWADGTKFDLAAIRKRSSDVGAALVIDGTQSIGALPFSVEEFQPDALIVASYKWLMGPYSSGFAYFGPYFDEGIPIEESWKNRLGSEDFSSLVNYQTQYQPGALRYEVGEGSNFISIPMLQAALETLQNWTVEAIQDYCTQLIGDSIEKLQSHGFRIEDEAYRASHLWGIRLPKAMNPGALKAELEKRKIMVSVRGDAVRVSPNVYNTPDEMNALTEALINLNPS